MRRRLLLAVALLLFGVPSCVADVDLVPAGSLWRYNDSGVDLCTGRAFTTSAVSDTAWPVGFGMCDVEP